LIHPTDTKQFNLAIQDKHNNGFTTACFTSPCPHLQT
jgi:hypothetical protein